MKTIRLILLSLMAGCIFAGPAVAHTMWVNIFESYAHRPGHALVTLGWGHGLPLDDLLITPGARMNLEKYEFIGPDLERIQLPLPDMTLDKGDKTSYNLKIHKGDMGVYKLALQKDTTPGIYQVVAATKPTYFTGYIDQKGKRRMKQLPIDQLDNPKKILMGMKYGAFAKSYLAVKKWSKPKPLGQPLEMIPLSDLSQIKVGDKAEFEVTFMGRPINRFVDDTLQYVTAIGTGFGEPDRFFLYAYITEGKAWFKVPAPGQWLVNVYFKQQVADNELLKSEADKCTTVYYASTITFNVKP